MQQRARAVAAVVLAAVLALGGCGGSEVDQSDVQERAESRAVQTRGFVDDLVTGLDGMGVEVTEDSTDPCDLAVEDSGLLHNYSVRFTVDEDAVARLQGEIADTLEADGWTVRRDVRDDERGIVSVRFLKDTFSMGSTISETGNATAGGSGGCVS